MINLHHAKAEDFITTLDCDSVDLCLIDPPYVLGKSGDFNGGRKYLDDMQNAPSWFRWGFDFGLLADIERVMKRLNMYVFCNNTLLAQLLLHYKDKEHNLDILAWHKKNPPPFIANTYLSDIEYCLFVRDKGVPLHGNYHTLSKLISTNTYKNTYDHPCVKPLGIMERLLHNSSKEGDTVLDLFSGTGTTAEACYINNRHFVGCEKEKKYYDIAKKRLANSQMKLL